MAAISWQGLTGFVRQQIAAVQASANAAVDASEGSITLALAQSVAGVALWLQGQVAQVLAITRASTSTGIDLDTWMADWFFTRLPATTATGNVTFSRFTATAQALVPIGSLVSTGPGGQQYIVTTDTGNAAYSASLGGYVAAAAVSSVTVPVSALTGGSGGNVLAGTITSFVQPIVGFDTVTNSAGFVNGADAESDASFLDRFQLYIASLRRGTPAAIRAAVLGIQQGLTAVVLENVLPNGTAQNGYLTVVVDDGTGSPPTATLDAAGAAVDLVRAAGIQFSVTGPTVVNATISLTVSSIDTTLHAADIVAAQAAITAYVNVLPVGATLVWARLYQLAFDSSANINGVSSILLNSGTSDLTATATQVIKTASVTVT